MKCGERRNCEGENCNGVSGVRRGWEYLERFSESVRDGWC